MKITKFGHCCLLIEEQGLKILTDPGNYNKTPDITGVDVILITHEHSDHLHIDSLKIVLQNNPQAKIITNASVGKLLDPENIPYQVVEHGQKTSVQDIIIEAFGQKHAVIYPDFPVVENTGYFIGGKFFYPGDAFTEPGQAVEILALPVAGPWVKLSEAIDYAKKINPKICFPVHDGVLVQDHRLFATRYITEKILTPLNIKFVDMIEGSSEVF